MNDIVKLYLIPVIKCQKSRSVISWSVILWIFGIFQRIQEIFY